jgi:hypothetical protein
MQKVKAILNPGYKESDALLYDSPNSKQTADVDPATTAAGTSAGAPVDPLAASGNTTHPIQDSKAGHTRYDSVVGAEDPLNRKPVGAGHPVPVQEESHLGRDAALGAGAAGAAGVAAHEHHRGVGHDHHHGAGTHTNPAATTVPPAGHQVINQIVNPNGEKYDPAMYPQGTQGTSALQGIPADARLQTHPGQKEHTILSQVVNPHGDKVDSTRFGTTGSTGHSNEYATSGGAPVDTTGTSHTHHHGRDAALGAGAVGAAEAAHHHHKHEEEEGLVEEGHEKKPGLLKRIFKRGDKDDVDDSTLTGTSGHQDGKLHKKHPDHHHDNHGAAADSAIPSEHTKDHHYGRDAALGAGALGAGAAVHHHHNQHDKHHDPTATHNTAGGIVHPEHGQQHHHGRDAPLGAGAVGAGTAAHHHHHQQHNTQQDPAVVGQQTSGGVVHPEHTQQHHLGRDAALGAGAVGAGTAAHHHHHQHDQHQGVAAAQPTTGGVVHPEHAQQHHLGRDAALGAGAVGAGTAAHHHHHQHDQQQGVTGVHPTAVGTLPQDQSQHHHLGRDAALGAGAIGAGTAAHHHHDKKEAERAAVADQTAHPVAPHQHHDQHRADAATGTGNDHHFGRDAAAGAGALGIGEAAHHHHEKQKAEEVATGEHADKERKPSILKRIFKRGDKDVDESEHTVEGDHEHHHGRDAALGAGAVGAGAAVAHHHHDKKHDKEVEELGVPADQKLHTHPEAKKHEHGIISQVLNPNNDKADHVRFGTTASTQAPASTEQTHHSHLGRDAAIGTGAAGATGLAAAHEHRKHELQNEIPAERTAAGAPTTGRGDLPQESATHTGAAPAVAAAENVHKDRHGVGAETSSPISPVSPTSTASIDSGPATKTQGPHKSNIMNILDPRVRPDFEQMKANKEVKKASIDGESSPTAATAAAGATTGAATTGIASHETPKSEGLEQHNTPAVAASHNVAGTNAPVNTGASAGLSNTIPQQHSNVAGESGVARDGENPYSSKPVDPRVNMPGGYPGETPVPQ